VYTATEKEHQTTRPIWEIKKERRDQIIAVIKRKKYVSIKDITLFVRNISEKTIQREIVAMVEEGVLKKEGNKRWSTYSLVQK
jgi:DeoR/GlpR family transcriptional regulator of sugar metabolism